MYTSSQARSIISAPKENTYRGYRVSPPNRADYASAEAVNHQTSLPTYRISPGGYETYDNTHYLQKSVNVPGYYRTKRPDEMTEILENDRIVGINSNPQMYETGSYNYYDNSHDTLKRQAPFLSTRAGSNRDEEHLLDSVEVSHITQRGGTPSSRKSKANTYFMAEKVYSMKMRSQGIMAALTPLAKSKNPNQTQLSSKNTTPANSQSAFRETDEYSSMIESYKLGDTSLVEITSRNQSMLQKNMSTNSLRSLGKSNSIKKGLNVVQSSVVKRENSLRSSTKSPCKPVHQNDKKLLTERNTGVSAQITPYQASNTLKKERSLKNLGMKVEIFADKINTTMWQISQRNKRIVLVMLLEMLHQHKLKVTQYLEQKTIILKSKYFSLWQRALLDTQIMIQQEKAEEMKCALAADFMDRKLIKKAFRVLQTLKNLKQETFKQKTNVHHKSAQLLRQSSSTASLKSAIPQNRATPRNTYQPKTSSTPKNNKTKAIPEQEKSVEKNKGKSNTGLHSSKGQTPATLTRSKSTEKDLKQTCVPLSSRAACTNQIIVAKNELHKSEIVETPGFRQNTGKVRFPTFGKAATYYYEPSEIQELTEVSQSPQKDPVIYQSNGLNQSFGCENLDHTSENVQSGFDSILADILNGPENDNSEKTNVPSFFTQPTKKEGHTLGFSLSSANLRNDDEFLDMKKIPQSARNYSPKKSDKEFSKSKSISGYQVPTKNNNITFLVMKAKPNRQSRGALKNNKPDSEEEKTQKAINFYNKNLCQKSINSLMCGDNEPLQNDNEARNSLADTHYYNNLKIKTLSGLLENYVLAYKSNELSKEHYEKNLLKNCFTTWCQFKPKSPQEDQVSDATYNEIVKRFRFIVLTEKALRQWKTLVNNNRKYGAK